MKGEVKNKNKDASRMSNTLCRRMNLLMTAACARNARNPTTRSTAWREVRTRIIVKV